VPKVKGRDKEALLFQTRVLLEKWTKEKGKTRNRKESGNIFKQEYSTCCPRGRGSEKVNERLYVKESTDAL